MPSIGHLNHKKLPMPTRMRNSPHYLSFCTTSLPTAKGTPGVCSFVQPTTFTKFNSKALELAFLNRRDKSLLESLSRVLSIPVISPHPGGSGTTEPPILRPEGLCSGRNFPQLRRALKLPEKSRADAALARELGGGDARG